MRSAEAAGEAARVCISEGVEVAPGLVRILTKEFVRAFEKEDVLVGGTLIAQMHKPWKPQPAMSAGREWDDLDRDMGA
jgi:hypothetical protein